MAHGVQLSMSCETMVGLDTPVSRFTYNCEAEFDRSVSVTAAVAVVSVKTGVSQCQ